MKKRLLITNLSISLEDCYRFSVTHNYTSKKKKHRFKKSVSKEKNKKSVTVTVCTMRNVTDLKIFIQFNLTIHIGVDFA